MRANGAAGLLLAALSLAGASCERAKSLIAELSSPAGADDVPHEANGAPVEGSAATTPEPAVLALSLRAPRDAEPRGAEVAGTTRGRAATSHRDIERAATPHGDAERAVPRRGNAVPASPASFDPARVLTATAQETFVHARPERRSRRLGYLRVGARVPRGSEPAGFHGCPGGWYAIAPEGFVCAGETATLDADHVMARAGRRRPDRRAILPYAYGQSRFPPPPLYTHVPSPREQAAAEPDLARRLRGVGTGEWRSAAFGEIPDFLAGGRPAPTAFGFARARGEAPSRALHGSGFAFLSLFQAETRAFGLTTDMAVVPLDRVRRVSPSDFQGLALHEGAGLPVVFVRSRGAYLYHGDPTSTGLGIERPLGHREAVPITGKRVRVGDAAYLETRSGGWIVDRNLVRVDAREERPAFVSPGRSWIDISILRQTLVAYEGDRPVYVTLVSTGAGGIGDPETTRATVRGRFLIHTKHVTASMSGDEAGDEFDLRDVPYVQYFTQGYALHAAYWHDAFGRPKSHGCINLSPLDARWLFHWTDPPVPMTWHGALSLRDGTLVSIHP